MRLKAPALDTGWRCLSTLSHPSRKSKTFGKASFAIITQDSGRRLTAPRWSPSHKPQIPLHYRRQSNMTKRKAIETEDLRGLNGTTGIAPTNEPHRKENAWSGPGPAAFDFRSKSLSSSALIQTIQMDHEN